jgi:hypothetical protein
MEYCKWLPVCLFGSLSSWIACFKIYVDYVHSAEWLSAFQTIVKNLERLFLCVNQLVYICKVGAITAVGMNIRIHMIDLLPSLFCREPNWYL